jgi:diguanylate cyclase (GGDEF)-like protein
MAGTLDERVDDDAIASVDALNVHARSCVAHDVGAALGAAEEALELALHAGYDLGRARALRTIGDCRRRLAEPQAAAGALAEAVGLFRAAGESTDEADTLTSLGLVHLDLERLRAAELAETGEALHRALGQVSSLLEELREQQVELERVARTDGVTGLASRRHFEETLEARFAAARVHGVELAVALLDVDHFKLVNDLARSHRVGDAVLREIAALLQVFCREADVVARWGGAEFAVLFPATARTDAAAACERIRSAVETHDWTTLHPGIRVTISGGIAGSGEADSADHLVFVADARLAEAKETGRNRVCW